MRSSKTLKICVVDSWRSRRAPFVSTSFVEISRILCTKSSIAPCSDASNLASASRCARCVPTGGIRERNYIRASPSHSGKRGMRKISVLVQKGAGRYRKLEMYDSVRAVLPSGRHVQGKMALHFMEQRAPIFDELLLLCPEAPVYVLQTPPILFADGRRPL